MTKEKLPLQKAKEAESKLEACELANSLLKEKIQDLKGELLTLNELLGQARKDNKELERLKFKLAGYKKVIQFIVGIENGDVLTSEVK